MITLDQILIYILMKSNGPEGVGYIWAALQHGGLCERIALHQAMPEELRRVLKGAGDRLPGANTYYLKQLAAADIDFEKDTEEEIFEKVDGVMY